MNPEPTGKSAVAGKVGRASRTPGQLWQVPTFFAGLLAVLLVAATAPWRQDNSQQDFSNDLQQLRHALAQKHEKILGHLPLVESLLARMPQFPRMAGEAHFLIGSAFGRIAHEIPGDKSRTYRDQAVAHLDQAQAFGVSYDDQPVLFYRLGRALYDKQDWKRAIDSLSRALDRGVDQQAAGYGMLVGAFLNLPQPDLDAALAANLKQIPYCEENELPPAWLMRGELLARKGKRREALAALEKIGPQAPQKIRLQARDLQVLCCQEEGLWNQAVPLWHDLLRDANDFPGGKARILFNLGLSYHRSEPANDKDAATTWEDTVTLGGEEGQVAGLYLGKLFLGGNPGRTLEEWSRALAKISLPKDYRNQLLPLERVREMFEEAWRDFQNRQDYPHAEHLVQLYQKLAAPGVAEERLGQTLEAWARGLEQKAKNSADPQADAWAKEAANQYLKAAAAFQASADARPGSQQSPLLWKSAQCYRAANNNPQLIEVLKRFVELPNTDDALAEGWLILAEAFRAGGDPGLARKAFESCIVFPNTPFAYRARYQLALDAISLGKREEAEEILKQNLTITVPNVDREAHGNSLYKLAELLYQRKNWDKASWFFKEATRQYPGDSRVLAAREQLGECYRKLADEFNDKLKENLLPDGIAYLVSARNTKLKEALQTYQKLADDLEEWARMGTPLPPEETKRILRARWNVAAILKELNDFPEAMRHFQILLDQNRGQLMGILACAEIWRCGKALDKMPEYHQLAITATRDALQKTLADVEMMPPDHEAFRLSRSRDQWLGWLRECLFGKTQPNANPVSPQ